MKLNTDLFVLSGCLTGQSEYQAGDELIGLSRALLYAGTKSMIVTLFPSFKEITSKIKDPTIQFARFYDFWLMDRYSKSKALQRYLQSIKINPQYAHPYNWMQFILIGNKD